MKNRQRIQTCIAGLLLLALAVPDLANSQPVSQPNSVTDSIGRYKAIMATRHQPGVSAHRGNSQLAPENTLATFQEVLRMQVDFIEIDVRTTQDNQLVILHDGSLNRTTTGSGPIKDQTLTTLKTLSAGKGFDNRFQAERIPTLAEVCQLVSRWNASHKTQTNLYVDCKAVAPQPLVETLQTYGLLKNAVFYGSDEALLALKQVAPTARLMPSLDKAEDMPTKISKLKPYAFDLNWAVVNESLIQQIHQQGIKAFSDLLDSFDTPENYQKAAQFHLDVIQTDYVLNVYKSLTQKVH
ncbi:glycerophosphodiester phosphodiesterase [Spirosoma foliorum]|uniref:Glycerophosphodiester phosphodiesterase family protein n=1 Tax=Spirosoma foliorum TaxID=2710596 RepID=A0A7G5GYI7_9BACT|nr:glycerophosphodiester phosphodiesterase family protein [Spirosoma foliorum]QMW03929.1 glycerophosphodiester phosphodiesterase family protein [Spirosoma foliorum]